MDMNAYVLELVIFNRLAELRQRGERMGRLRQELPPARPLRVALGDALVRLGQRLQGVRDYSLAALDARGHGAVRG
jgi:hypothetical protein